MVDFNSGEYDLNVLKDVLIPYLVNHSCIDLAMERNHTYLALKTTSLKFVDISNLVAAGTSHATVFLKPASVWTQKDGEAWDGRSHTRCFSGCNGYEHLLRESL